jgi:hypothetical protein
MAMLQKASSAAVTIQNQRARGGDSLDSMTCVVPTRSTGIVVESRSDLRDADIEVPIEVDERAVAPELVLDLLAGQNLTCILRQQAERL